MPRKSEFEDAPKEDIFTEYACDCGVSWPKDQGKVCPECGETEEVAEEVPVEEVSAAEIEPITEEDAKEEVAEQVEVIEEEQVDITDESPELA